MTHPGRRPWHACDDLVTRYAEGTLPEADAWSLEKHVETCTGCASRVSAAVRGTAAGTVLAQVRAAVLEPTRARTAVPEPAHAREGAPEPARAQAQARAAVPEPAHARTAVPQRAPVRGQAEVPGPADPAWQGGAAPEPRARRKPGRSAPTRFAPSRLLRLLWADGPAVRGAWLPAVAARTRVAAAGPGADVAEEQGAAQDPRRSGPSRFPRLPWAGRAFGGTVPSRFLRLLWATGPAVRGAWLPAVVAVAVGALVLSYGAGYPGARALLLAVAPLVPVAGVALSYGPHADPLHEVAAATPGGGLRLALTRTVAVLAVSLPLLTLAGLLLPASGAPGAAAWLLPGLALALATLALASFTGCRTAAGVTGGGWLLAVLAAPATAPSGAATARLAGQLSRCLDGAAAQSGWAAAAALSAALLLARRPVYDRPLRP
ncbi:zf-HC2 domain-containing protein [Streptomyces sp. NPDC006309]|uniref:zf-HC2 domain-containing protein n=1 Tax=Streptomyces sp. NPDC006309 TaxID=3156749 RepID=UPI0033BC4B7E